MASQMQDGLGKFGNCGKKIVPVPDFQHAEVSFDLKGGLFTTYVEQLHDNLNSCQVAQIPELEDLRQLLYDLLYLRVAYVKRMRIPFPIIGTRFLIPAFFAQILFSIGRVESDEFGLILMPTLPKPFWDVSVAKRLQVAVEDEELEDMDLPEDTSISKPILNPSWETRSLEEITKEALRLSRLFRPFFDTAGVEYSTELPKSRDGNISLMTLQMIESCVKAESKRNEPVYALMAAVLYNEISSQVLLGRINYGGIEYLRTLIYQVGDYERRNL